MKRWQRRVLIAGMLAGALVGCSSTRESNEHLLQTTTPQSFWVGESPSDRRTHCNGGGAKGAPVNALLTLMTMGIYSPGTLRAQNNATEIYCF